MTAIQAMTAYLTSDSHIPWKPDRSVAAQIRHCSKCDKWKQVREFSPTDHLCRICRALLSKQRRRFKRTMKAKRA